MSLKPVEQFWMHLVEPKIYPTYHMLLLELRYRYVHSICSFKQYSCMTLNSNRLYISDMPTFTIYLILKKICLKLASREA